jgi:GGDEF domain-containing protein
VGYAIQEAAVPGQIGARIGGDEFEVIFPCRDELSVKHWVNIFEQSLENYNKKSGKTYDVHASWGYKTGVPAAKDTIESYMKESDDIMYKNKVLNKTKRNEALR